VAKSVVVQLRRRTASLETGTLLHRIILQTFLHTSSNLEAQDLKDRHRKSFSSSPAGESFTQSANAFLKRLHAALEMHLKILFLF
jgi:hypothetical protein